MLDYEWGSTNPPPIIISGEESESVFDPTHSHNFTTFVDTHHNTFLPPPPPPPYTPPSTAAFKSHFGEFYDHPQSYTMGPPSHHYDSVDGGGGGDEFMMVPKSEDVIYRSAAPVEFAARIGLNLGGRTYFSSEEEEFVNRLYRRTRSGGEIGSGNWAVRCQAEGCNADLSQAKHYHRRHKVCEFHSKASTVITAGLTQRFCQQCSRFHVLGEFDNGKRSCRKRLADHNRRRRKTQQSHHQGSPNSSSTQQILDQTTTTTSSTDSASRLTMETTEQSSEWSVTVAVSPASMSMDCLNQRPF